MISSFFEGRVRLRHPALKNPETVEGILPMLNMYPGILKTESNPQTGSLLVLYDPEVISIEDLQVAAKVLEDNLGPAHPETDSGCASASLSKSLCRMLPRKREISLLNASFALCLLGLFGARRLHVWAGGAFALLTVAHILRRR